jgi:hypothetical protein
MADPVHGTLRVMGVTDPAGHTVSTRYRLQGMVSAEGVTPTPVEHTGKATGGSWPWPGTNLPVLVDRRDPTRFRILWDEIPASRDASLHQAQRLAHQMRSGQQQPSQPADVTPLEPSVPSSLLLTGERARATVISAGEVAAPTGAPPPEAGVYEISLDLTQSDRSRRQVSIKIGFSTAEGRDRIARVGAELPVRIDPNDPSRVVLDTVELGFG